MENKSEAAKSCGLDLQRALVSATNDSVRTSRSQSFNTAKGLNKERDGSQSLSKIDDVEVFKYLNNKKEAHYKRLIWEVMNRDYLKGNNHKRVKTEKKADSTKKVAKPPRADDTKKRLSSKINYDILNKLNYDDRVDKIDNDENMDSRQIELRSENEQSNSGVHSSGDDLDNEVVHENTGSDEGDDDIQDCYGMEDPEIEDDDDEYTGCGEEYDYEEY